MYCLDAGTGAKLWDFTTRNMVDGSPAVVNGRVYIGSLDGNLYCFGDLSYEMYIVNLKNEVPELRDLNQELETDVADLSSLVEDLQVKLAETKVLLGEYEHKFSDFETRLNAMGTRGIPIETIVLGIVVLILLAYQFRQK